MRRTLTMALWVALHQFYQGEYACDYYYENGVCVGSNQMYSTGRTRCTYPNKA